MSQPYFMVKSVRFSGYNWRRVDLPFITGFLTKLHRITLYQEIGKLVGATSIYDLLSQP